MLQAQETEVAGLPATLRPTYRVSGVKLLRLQCKAMVGLLKLVSNVQQGVPPVVCNVITHCRCG